MSTILSNKFPNEILEDIVKYLTAHSVLFEQSGNQIVINAEKVGADAIFNFGRFYEKLKRDYIERSIVESQNNIK